MKKPRVVHIRHGEIVLSILTTLHRQTKNNKHIIDCSLFLRRQFFREIETVLNVVLMNNDEDDLVISITNEYVKIVYVRNRENSRTTLTKVLFFGEA